MIYGGCQNIYEILYLLWNYISPSLYSYQGVDPGPAGRSPAGPSFIMEELMAAIKAHLDFVPVNGGQGRTESGYNIDILNGEDSARPYELLFMALGSCMYSTFEDIIVKKRLNCESVQIDVSGEKRTEVPAFLQTCDIKFTVKGADNPDGFRKSFDLACKYCSIFQTLKKVAEMKPEIVFI